MIDLDDLAKRLRCRFGLSPRTTWAVDAERALGEMSRRMGGEASQVYGRLWRDQDLLAEFVAYLTVQESFFLRHPEHFGYLVKAVSERLPSATRSTPISIWSAGCANGEEPYSAAIMIHAGLGARALERVRISASDITGSAIQKARAGRYSGWSFRGTPPWFLARYFDQADGSKCLIADPIRRAVSFERRALEDSLMALPDDSIDFLFFRNVAIYLDPTALERFFDDLHRVLKPSGTLFMAPTDPRPPATVFESIDHDLVGIFRRSGVERRSRAGDQGTSAVRESPVSEPLMIKVAVRRHGNGRLEPTVPCESTEGVPLDLSPIALIREASNIRIARNRVEKEDRGNALRIAARLIRSAPTSKEGYLLRAWIHFTSQTFEEAVADLRRVVFLDREDKIARFWFATALRCAQQATRSFGEIEELMRQLEILPADMVLEDGATTVSELKTAVTHLSKVSNER